MTDTGFQHTSDTQARVAFIIPHKGREEMLLQTLRSIAQLDRDGFAVEVHLVTQNDSVSDEIHAIPDIDLTVHYRSDDGNISKSRNLGLQSTNAEYVAFIDADILLKPSWLVTLCAELKKPSRIVVAARQSSSDSNNVVEQIKTAIANTTVNSTVKYLPGCNLLLRRKDALDVGGFPENLRTCEDIFFTSELSNHGYLYHSGQTSFIHLGEDKSFAQMSKKEFWRGQSNLRSINGRKVPLRELPSFFVPIVILLCWIMTVILILMEHLSLAAIPLLLSLALLLAYSIRLKRKVISEVAMFDLVRFYTCYFPARAIGTLKGFFIEFNTDSHS